MKSPIKISVLTGSRADYGLLRQLMAQIRDSPQAELETIVTGTHFSPEFGDTWRAILADGIPITYRVDILPPEDNALAVAKSAGSALSQIAEVLNSSKPSVLVVLGDRFEAHAAAEAAFLLGIPVAHIAGGEKTEGALDDSLRHSISKFSSLHFVAADEYMNRVVQLGENPATVYNVGAIGLDNFSEVEKFSLLELSQFINFDLCTSPFLLCTIHPETTLDISMDEFFEPARFVLSELQDFSILLTKANSDAGGRRLNELFENFENEQPHRVKVISSLGQKGYISALEFANAVVGNSSSGILEAPSAGTPTVNIGDRQKGRIRASSVIDVENNIDAIRLGIEKALSKEFQELSMLKLNPFGVPGVSERIFSVLVNTNFHSLLPKSFYDLPSGA